MDDIFRKVAHKIGAIIGSSKAFVFAFFLIIAWALLGPTFNYSNTWQLFINTGTTILTFLIVFLIQNMQNRDAKAIQLKLDELIRAQKGARNKMVDLENMPDLEIKNVSEEFTKLKERADKKKK